MTGFILNAGTAEKIFFLRNTGLQRRYEERESDKDLMFLRADGDLFRLIGVY